MDVAPIQPRPDPTGSAPPLGKATVYERIRRDIVEGRLAAGSRLKVGALAERYGSSTNPVREALQQLRGEGFVLFSHNRGARVRPIDEDFVRNIYEICALVEPYMTRWFVGYASDEDVARLEATQTEIEALGFDDPEAYSRIDYRFHCIVYDRHYNRDVLEMWRRYREVICAIGFRVPFSRARRQAILHEHREMIDRVRLHDADGAAAVVERHVKGSGQHLIEHIRAVRAQGEQGRS